MQYKTSIFNIYEKKENGKYLIYNMLSQSSLIIEDSLYKELQSNSINFRDTLEPLQRGKFIVEKQINEKIELKQRLLNAANISDTLPLTICTTTDCNMKCVYCYEEGIQQTTLTIDTIDSIINWLRNITKANSVKKLVIMLFGGEPTIALNETILLMKKINCFGKENGIYVEYMMGTNGVLLSSETVDILSKYGLKSAQITIDGPKNIQDDRRPLKCNNSGYDLIIKNLPNIVDMINIVIKINIDKENINLIGDLLTTFENIGIKNKITIKFEAIAVSPASTEQEEHHCQTKIFNSRNKELALAYHYIMDLADKRGFRVDKSTAHSTPCMYSSKDGLVIDADGLIYKCISAIGIEEFCVGDIKNEKFNDRYEKAINYIEKIDECLENECPYVPKCGAGCVYDIYCRTKSMDGDDCKKNYLKSFYSIKFNKLYQQSIEVN